MKMVLTEPEYWAALQPATRAYWQSVADRHPGVTVCTHRPSAKQFHGNCKVRRCSTGGRWGKSADVVQLDVQAMLSAGYDWRCHEPAAVVAARGEQLVAALRANRYNDDTPRALAVGGAL